MRCDILGYQGAIHLGGASCINECWLLNAVRLGQRGWRLKCNCEQQIAGRSDDTMEQGGVVT